MEGEIVVQRNRAKKGISTIIAAVFMIAVIIIGLSAITSGLSFQNNLGQVVTQRNTEETEQGTERIELRDVGIDSNKFNLTVVNTGPLPTKLIRMWVTNTTATTGWHKNYTLNDVINPGDSLPKLGQALSLVAKPDASYDLNVVTERGSTASFKIMSPKDTALKMSVFSSPRSSPPLGNVTLMFGVANNRTDGSMIQSITPTTPTISYTNTPGGTVAASATLIEGPTPVTERSLMMAETIFFKYVYKVNGDPKDKITFSFTIQNAKLGNSISESVEISAVATQQSVIGQITTNSGLITMNFTSFQFCAGDTGSPITCQSNSANWQGGWNADDDTKYYWRVDVTNNGVRDIFLDDDTDLFLLQVSDGGAGNIATDLYLMADATTTTEPAAYTSNFSKSIPANGQWTTLYFGGSDRAAAATQKIGDVGLHPVLVMFFGFFDENDNHTYQSGTDNDPYSQTIPFQAVITT